MCEFTTASGPVVISHYENSVRTGICFFSKFGLFVCFVLVKYFLEYKGGQKKFSMGKLLSVYLYNLCNDYSCFSHGALKGKFVPEAEENSEAEK